MVALLGVEGYTAAGMGSVYRKAGLPVEAYTAAACTQGADRVVYIEGEYRWVSASPRPVEAGMVYRTAAGAELGSSPRSWIAYCRN